MFWSHVRQSNLTRIPGMLGWHGRFRDAAAAAWLMLIMLVLITGCGKQADPNAAKKKLADLGKNFTRDDLVKSVRAGELEAVQAYLDGGMDPNFPVPSLADPDTEKSLLHMAVDDGNTKLLEILIAGKADREAKIKSLNDRVSGLTPLGLALLLGKPEQVSRLLALGANVNGAIKYFFKGESLSLPPLMFVQKVCGGSISLMKILLDHGADPNGRGMIDKGSEGFFFNPLYLAVMENRLEEVELLLEREADPLGKVKIEDQEKTILELSRTVAKPDIVSLLGQPRPSKPLIPSIVWVFAGIVLLGLGVFRFFPGLLERRSRASGDLDAIAGKLSDPHLAVRTSGLQKLVGGFSHITDPWILGKIEELCGDEDPGVQFWAKKARSKFLQNSAAPNSAAAREGSPVTTVPAPAPVSAPAAAATPTRVPVPPPARPPSLEEVMVQLQGTTSGSQCRFLIQQILDRRDPAGCGRLIEYLGTCQDVTVISFLTKNLGITFPNEDIVPILKNYLKHPDDRVVANTIEGLEAMGKSESFVVLAQMLNHKSHRVQANAAKALGKFDPATSREMLGKMLQQTERPHFVIAACKAIRETGDTCFLPALVQLGPLEVVGPDALETILALGGLQVLAALRAKVEGLEASEQKERLLGAIAACESLLSQAPPPALPPSSPQKPGD